MHCALVLRCRDCDLWNRPWRMQERLDERLRNRSCQALNIWMTIVVPGGEQLYFNPPTARQLVGQGESRAFKCMRNQ